ncbi:hypothetical protein ACXIZN_16195 [Amycolatopsis sp. TRM77291]
MAFADAKLDLEPDEIRRRLARDIRRADAVARTSTRLSRGRRVTSTCDLDVTGSGTAAAFLAWFNDTGRDDYARSMIAANPDHFLIDTAPDGRQEVIETTGGSPLATRFLIDYADTAEIITHRNPEFPLDASGVARTGTGLAIGGVRHEFRDHADGFHAHLCVESLGSPCPQWSPSTGCTSPASSRTGSPWPSPANDTAPAEATNPASKPTPSLLQ